MSHLAMSCAPHDLICYLQNLTPASLPPRARTKLREHGGVAEWLIAPS